MARRSSDIKDSNDIKRKAPTKNVGAISAERISKENKSNGKSMMSKIVTFFLVLILIGLCCGILLSPSFNLEEIIVEDGVNIKSAEIINSVNVNYGENVFKQNFGEIKKSVMSLSYIESAKVSLALPNKIKISYVERKPYLALKYLESFAIFDKYGYLLEIKKNNNEELPLIYGIDMTPYDSSETLTEVSKNKLKNVVMMLETARQKNFPYIITEINYESIGEVKMWLKDVDVEIVYGDIDKTQITDKLTYLSGVLKEISNKSGKLDISSDNYLEKTIFSERY